MATPGCVRPTPVLPTSSVSEPTPNFVLQEPVAMLTPPLAPFARLRDPSQLNIQDPVTLYFLATLARCSYANTGAHFAAAAATAFGINSQNTFIPNSSSSVPGYGIIVTPSGGAICIISGSTNLNQWLEQTMLGSLVQTNYNLNDSAQALATYVSAAATIDAALTAASALTNNVLLVGHSMGGAVAAVLNYKQQWNGREGRSSCVTFAAPKAGNQSLSEGVSSGPSQFNRLIIQGDIVPALPPDPGLFSKAFVLGLPVSLQSTLSYWSSFYPPNQALEYVDPFGNLSYGNEPNIAFALLAAVLGAAANQPIVTAVAHSPATFCSNLLEGIGGFQKQIQEGWSFPAGLIAINNTLTNLGL